MLLDGLESRGLRLGRPIAVRYGRVKLAEHVAECTGARLTILLIGEQRDHGSSGKLQEVLGELGATNTVIYTIAFSPAKNQFLSELRYGPDGPKKPDPPTTYSSSPHPAAQSRSQTDVERSEEPGYPDHAPLLELPPLLQLAVNALSENTAAELASLSGGEYVNGR